MNSFDNILVLQWLLIDFLGYLAEREDEVASVPGLQQSERQKLTLSRETMDGLKIIQVCNRFTAYHDNAVMRLL